MSESFNATQSGLCCFQRRLAEMHIFPPLYIILLKRTALPAWPWCKIRPVRTGLDNY